METNEPCSRCGLISRVLQDVPEPSSAVVNLYKANDTASNSARRVLKDDLAIVQSRICEVSDDISRSEGMLDTLRQEHQRLLDIADTYGGVLHPIRYVPVEVLNRIFESCVDTSAFYDLNLTYKGDTLNTSKLPWNLSYVCRRWRTMVLTNPVLWSFVGLRFPNPKESNAKERQKGMVFRLLLQIQRSRQQPLAVALETHHELDEYDPLLVVLCAHSARWKALRIFFNQARLRSFQRLSSLIKGNIPELRHIHLRVGNPIPLPINDAGTAIDGFEYAPKLQDLTVWGHTRSLTDVFRMPWDQITRYRVFDDHLRSIEETMDIEDLSRMSNLRIFHQLRGFVNRIVTSSPLCLPFLHTVSFVVQGNEPNYGIINSLLELLTLSNLRDLRIEATPEILCLPQFLSRHANTLRTLKLYIGDPLVVGSLLESAPGVEHLEIRGDSVEVLRVLSDRYDSSAQCRLLPRLHRLALWTLREEDTLDADLVLATARSRTRPRNLQIQSDSTKIDSVYQFRILQIDRDFQLNAGTLGELQELQASGLEVIRDQFRWFFQTPGDQWT